ncbi:MAG TPA: hypothetical protein DCE23_03795, partial [Firmicutes bacterium]|nr:hypothetical protein [Bacillota bacterium]
MDKKRKSKHRKLRIKLLCQLLISIILIASFCMYIFNLRIKNIYITGTDKIKDITIIDATNIRDYPKIFLLNKKKMQEQ